RRGQQECGGLRRRTEVVPCAVEVPGGRETERPRGKPSQAYGGNSVAHQQFIRAEKGERPLETEWGGHQGGVTFERGRNGGSKEVHAGLVVRDEPSHIGETSSVESGSGAQSQPDEVGVEPDGR